MKKEADTFLDDTWEDLNSISTKIFNYAMVSKAQIYYPYYVKPTKY